jgi:hypothetical protein
MTLSRNCPQDGLSLLRTIDLPNPGKPADPFSIEVVTELDPRDQCSLEWQTTELPTGQVYMLDPSTTPYTVQEIADYKTMVRAQAAAKTAVDAAMNQLSAATRESRINRSLQASISYLDILAEISAKGSQLAATAQLSDVMIGRAGLNNPTNYVDLDKLIGFARKAMNPQVGSVIQRLADRVTHTISASSTFGRGLSKVLSLVPFGSLGQTIAIEVARNLGGKIPVDVDKVSKAFGTDQVTAVAVYDTLTNHLDVILTTLQAENATVIEYSRGFDELTQESEALRGNANDVLGSLVAGPEGDSNVNALVKSLEGSGLIAVSPSLVKLRSALTARVNGFAKGGPSTGTQTTDRLLDSLEVQQQRAAAVEGAYQRLNCRFQALYSDLQKDLARPGIPGFPDALNQKWTNAAKPLREKAAAGLVNFVRGYGVCRTDNLSPVGIASR